MTANRPATRSAANAAAAASGVSFPAALIAIMPGAAVAIPIAVARARPNQIEPPKLIGSKIS